jgi:murein DD-endopeptidase MepM/ murein hydrolase activator NlpD
MSVDMRGAWKMSAVSRLVKVVILSLAALGAFAAAAVAAPGTNGWHWPAGTEATGGYLGWLGYNSAYGGYHLGQDFKMNWGDPIYAIAAGEVLEARSDVGGYGPGGTAGGAVLILHKTSAGQDFKALYGHVERIQIAKGSTVSAGKVIGYANNFSPPHVHFGIHPGRSYPPDGNPWRGYTPVTSNTYGWVNPVSFLKTNLAPASPPPLTADPTLSPSSTYPGVEVTGSFTIKNSGSAAIEMPRLKLEAIDPEGNLVMYPGTTLTLGAGKSYTLTQTRSFSTVGRYQFYVIYQDTAGKWHRVANSQGVNPYYVNLDLKAGNVSLPGTVTPNSGSLVSGLWRDVTFTATDKDGAANIRWANLLLGPSKDYNANWAKEIYIVAHPNGTISLFDLAGNSVSGRAGEEKVLATETADIDLARSTVSLSGETLSVSLRLRPHLIGPLSVYLRARDNSDSTGLYTTPYAGRGTITLTNQPPAAGSLSPNSGALDTNAFKTLVFSGTDSDGATQIRWMRLLLGPDSNYQANWPRQVLFHLNPQGGITLYGSAADKSVRGVLGDTGLLESETAVIDLARSSITASGTTLTASVSLRPKVTGQVKAYLTVLDQTFTQTGQVERGAFELKALTENATVARAVEPGWQLIAGSAGSDCLGASLFSFDGGSCRSVQAAGLVAGKGYWGYFPQAGTLQLRTAAPPLIVPLTLGWNLIGNATPGLVTLPQGKSAFVFEQGRYVSRTSLAPGEGAWLGASAAEDLVLGW